MNKPSQAPHSHRFEASRPHESIWLKNQQLVPLAMLSFSCAQTWCWTALLTTHPAPGVTILIPLVWFEGLGTGVVFQRGHLQNGCQSEEGKSFSVSFCEVCISG